MKLTYSNALLVLILIITHSGLSVEAPSDPLLAFRDDRMSQTPEEIKQILNEGSENPAVLERLRKYPIAYSFNWLWSAALPGTVIRGNTDAERQRIAREVMLTHPEMEEFLSSVFARMREEWIKQFDRDPSTKPDSSVNFYDNLLGYARTRPGNEAFRLLGPCLFTPYFPEQEKEHFSSPADHAKGYLNWLRKERLNEPPLETIEEARRWWKDNAQRFGAPPPPPPSDPVASEKDAALLKALSIIPGKQEPPNPVPATPAPATPHRQASTPPPNTPAPVVAAPQKNAGWWTVAVAALIIVVFLALRRRKA